MMSTPNPNSQNEPPAGKETASAPESASSPRAAPLPRDVAAPRPARRGTLVLLGFGLTAGVLSWFLVEHFHGYFELPPELAAKNTPFDEETEKQIRAAALVRDSKNMVLTYGLIGLVLCALLGLGQGVFRRSAGRAVGGFVLGAFCGAATGAAAGTAVIAIREQLNMVFSVNLFSYTLNLGAYQKAVAMHVAAWIIISLGVGVSVGMWASRKVRAILRSFSAAAAGGLVIGLLFPVIAAAILPFETPEMPRPEGSWTVLLWTVTVCTLIGWAVGRVTQSEVAAPTPNANSA